MPKAEEDLDDIFYYIAIKLNNTSAAEKIINKFSDQILRLQVFPFSGSLLEDDLLKDKRYRKLIIDNYIFSILSVKKINRL